MLQRLQLNNHVLKGLVYANSLNVLSMCGTFQYDTIYMSVQQKDDFVKIILLFFSSAYTLNIYLSHFLKAVTHQNLSL